ncbi:MAG: hypothetical protein U0998_07415 [Moraxellaceae bacterium]|nr:hypothetical protein [Moraxellaceae bacterium]MDP1775574.1 hypothetical protein [Moraxellaceae bacterium]MDZ4298254.1 hypothetical protein [Moraxellaceae bacterium]MDZ4387021.1 hypothetical protein [Moraxellaceae bacterium]
MASLPTISEVEQLLKTFFRREIDVSTTAAPAVPLSYAGAYVSGDGSMVAAVRADIGFAASSSAAFALIPAGVAKENIQSGKLDETFTELYAEVLNVLSRLFANRDNDRVTLSQKDIGQGTLASGNEKQALHIAVDVDGYAPGKLSFYLL